MDSAFALPGITSCATWRGGFGRSPGAVGSVTFVRRLWDGADAEPAVTIPGGSSWELLRLQLEYAAFLKDSQTLEAMAIKNPTPIYLSAKNVTYHFKEQKEPLKKGNEE